MNLWGVTFTLPPWLPIAVLLLLLAGMLPMGQPGSKRDALPLMAATVCGAVAALMLTGVECAVRLLLAELVLTAADNCALDCGRKAGIICAVAIIGMLPLSQIQPWLQKQAVA